MRSCTTFASNNYQLQDFKLGNLGDRKWKAQTTALYPVFLLKIRFYSYLVENSQKAMLKFYFKSRFSMKPSKSQMYFAKDCLWK